MGRWCPNCRAEYVEGWGTCSDCGVPLVASLPPERIDTVAEPATPRDTDDPFVPIWEGPTTEAEVIRRKIEAAHIPVEFGDALEVGHARVEVPRSYLGEVRDVVSGALSDWPREVTVDTADGSFRWSPTVRIALVVIAIVLMLVLALA